MVVVCGEGHNSRQAFVYLCGSRRQWHGGLPSGSDGAAESSRAGSVERSPAGEREGLDGQEGLADRHPYANSSWSGGRRTVRDTPEVAWVCTPRLAV